jgi:hypothetical protein
MDNIKKLRQPKPKQYKHDAAMKLAMKRAAIQPKLISMTSNIRIWEDRGT